MLRARAGGAHRSPNPGPPKPHVPARRARNPSPSAAARPRASRCGLVPAPERAARAPRRPLGAAPPPPGFSPIPLPRPLRTGFSLRAALPSAGPPSPGPAPTHCKLAAAARPGEAGGRRARARGRASPRPAAAAAAEGTTEPAPGVAAPAARRGRCLPEERRRHERGRPLMALCAGSQRAGRPEELSREQLGCTVRQDRQAGSAAAAKPHPRPPRLRPETPRSRPEPSSSSCLRLQFGISPVLTLPPVFLCVLGLVSPPLFFLSFSQTLWGPDHVPGLRGTAATKTWGISK